MLQNEESILEDQLIDSVEQAIEMAQKSHVAGDDRSSLLVNKSAEFCFELI